MAYGTMTVTTLQELRLLEDLGWVSPEAPATVQCPDGFASHLPQVGSDAMTEARFVYAYGKRGAKRSTPMESVFIGADGTTYEPAGPWSVTVERHAEDPTPGGLRTYTQAELDLDYDIDGGPHNE